jgi:putative addiction module component (TIGR02574 family)
MNTSKEIFDKAMSLSLSERANLAHQLILSLEDPSEYELSPEYETEIQRRLNEVKEGTAKEKPIEEVVANIRAKYK